MCVCVCLCTHVCVCVRACMCMYVHVCMYIHVCFSVHKFVVFCCAVCIKTEKYRDIRVHCNITFIIMIFAPFRNYGIICLTPEPQNKDTNKIRAM